MDKYVIKRTKKIKSFLLFLDFISDTFLVAALFCIGTQINSESIKEIDSKTFLLALGLWIIALVSSYLLINVFL